MSFSPLSCGNVEREIDDDDEFSGFSFDNSRMVIKKPFKCMFKKDSNTQAEFVFVRLFRQTRKNLAKLHRKISENFSFSFGCKVHTCKFGLEIKRKATMVSICQPRILYVIRQRRKGGGRCSKKEFQRPLFLWLSWPTSAIVSHDDK